MKLIKDTEFNEILEEVKKETVKEQIVLLFDKDKAEDIIHEMTRGEK